MIGTAGGTFRQSKVGRRVTVSKRELRGPPKKKTKRRGTRKRKGSGPPTLNYDGRLSLSPGGGHGPGRRKTKKPEKAPVSGWGQREGKGGRLREQRWALDDGTKTRETTQAALGKQAGASGWDHIEEGTDTARSPLATAPRNVARRLAEKENAKKRLTKKNFGRKKKKGEQRAAGDTWTCQK